MSGYARRATDVTSVARLATHAFAFSCGGSDGGGGELECKVWRELGIEEEAARQAGERVVSTERGQTRGKGWVNFGVLGRTRGVGCTARRSAVSTG